MCKRIWDQEPDPVTQPHPMLGPTVKSGKAGGPGPKLWLRLCNSADGSAPLCHPPSQIPGPEGHPPLGAPPGLGSIWQCPVFSLPPSAGGHWCWVFLDARGKPETGNGSRSSPKARISSARTAAVKVFTRQRVVRPAKAAL